ncbi:sensor histidine kinase [Portibacter marinus]|uniref:sensor histidine kinase n=1 Tax=Portibacter marinus TaxID=2898660 RepID=UPI001F380603|nr:ATP-binding protein [Portibacter marinus]
MNRNAFILTLLLIFGIRQGSGQDFSFDNVELDSMLGVFNNTKNDSVKIVIAEGMDDNFSYLGFNATNSGQFAKSYKIYREAFEFWESEEISSLFKKFPENPAIEKSYYLRLANLYFNFGHLMGATGNNLERKINYEKAYELAKKRDDVVNIVYCLSGLTLIHLERNEVDSARLLMEQALTYPAEQVGFNYSTLLYLDGMAKYEWKNYEAARRAFTMGVRDATKRENIIGQAFNNFALSKTFSEIQELDSSYFYALQALEIMNDLQEIQVFGIDISHVYEHFSDYFLQVGPQDSALFYLQLAYDKRTELNEKKLGQMAAFQQELLRREKNASREEKERIERESRFRTYSFLSILGGLSVLGFILYRSYRQKQKANILLASQKEEIQKTLTKLKQTQAQLIQSEKMASLGELTAGIAHEIQNPLNFVNNFSELSNELIDEMNEEMEKGDIEEAKLIAADISQNLNKINHHGKRADAIVKGMLQHSRKSTADKEPTDINKLADEYLRLAYHGLRAKDKSFNAQLDTDFDDNIGLIQVMAQDMGRVLLNLITNAFYAVKEKQTQSEEAGNEYSPIVSVSTEKVDDHIIISVKDNGNGIPEEVVEKIFQPFFTTKPTGEGTGLGLSMSYDIVKAHDGKIEVSTEENDYTIFKIYLPY